MTHDECAREIARCDAEIAAAEQQQNAPAYLVTLGIEDWRAEKRLIEREAKGL